MFQRGGGHIKIIFFTKTLDKSIKIEGFALKMMTFFKEAFQVNRKTYPERVRSALFHAIALLAFTRKTTEGSTEIDNGGADKITDYAKTAMQWAVGSGFVKGKSGNLLDPQGTATRAEIAAMIHRFIEKYELVQARLPAA